MPMVSLFSQVILQDPFCGPKGIPNCDMRIVVLLALFIGFSRSGQFGARHVQVNPYVIG